MKCIFCDGTTGVARSVKALSGRRVTRERVCKLDGSHRFKTEESVPPPALSDVGVRRSGSGEVGEEPFDRERLFRDISSAILGKDRHDDDRIDLVVTRTVRALERNYDKIVQPLSAAEAARLPNLKGAVLDTTIADIVESQMDSKPMRMQRLLYALSIRGRQDREGRAGWSDASDVLEWIGATYAQLVPSIPEPADRGDAVVWTIRSNPRHPDRIVKRDPRSESRPFVYEQFVRSINAAMLGRRDPEERSDLIARTVLSACEGQSVVSASQLGAGVLTCLRHVDDIAYLRWATILKRIPTVTAFTIEARALIEHPSPRFVVRTLDPEE